MRLFRSLKEFVSHPAVQGGLLFLGAGHVWDGVTTMIGNSMFPLIVETNPLIWGEVQGMASLHNLVVVKLVLTCAVVLMTAIMYKAAPKFAWLPGAYYGWQGVAAGLGNTLIYWRMHG